MADEELGRAVLCEAMEYLTKLASNLGSRTVSMKEKRINRDKLKNSHSVKSAAEKVLLLCELSKKSIENVEKSVKKMLDGSGTSDGGKTVDLDKNVSRTSATKKATSSPSNYSKITISGKKYVLRMPKKVNVKHFMSVKVRARSMPKSMLAKYPVYEYCKLYRERKCRENIARMLKRTKSLDSDSDKNESDNKGESVETVTVKKTDEEIDDDDISTESKTANRTLGKDGALSDSDNENKGSNNKKKQGEHSIHNKTEKMNKNDKLDISNKSDIISDSEPETKKRSVKTRKKSRSDRKSSCSDGDKNKQKSSKRKSKIIATSDSDNDDEGSKKKDEPELKCARSDIELDSENQCLSQAKQDGNKTDDSDTSIVQKKLTKKNSKSGSSSDEDEKVKSSRRSRNNSSKEKITEASVIELDSDENKSVDQNEDSVKITNSSDIEDKENVADKNEDQKTEPTKPLIKLVNINKLLKPEIAAPEHKTVVVHINQRREVNEKIIDISKKSQSKSREEKFWAQKRLEVSQFKPKNFVIKVYRLSQSFDAEFLHKQKLKKIIQNGKTVYEVKDETDDIVGHASDDDMVQPADSTLIRAKNALLDDSDIETCPNDALQHESDNVKKSLLDDSASDGANEGKAVKNGTPEMVVNSRNIKDKSNEKESSSDVSLRHHDASPEKELTAANNDHDASPEREMVAKTDDHDGSPETETTATNDDHDPGPQKKLKETNVDGGTSPVKEKAVKNDDQDKEQAKSALLNDSSASNSSHSGNKRKRRDSDKKSQRKHIMESMHAKKMLLTYSSSSDTEDEQLKNVLKDIKDSLLKEIPSDEEDKTEKNTEKKSTSSESEEEVVKPVKKKRKVSMRKNNKSDSNNDTEDQTDKENGNNSSSEKSSSTRKKMGRSRAKPDGNSSNNSESQDDKVIEGLTNLKSLRKSRHRRSGESGSKKARGSRAMATPHIKGDVGLLEAPSSSDNEVSAGDSDAAEEDLPPVSLSGLNGSDALEHLAKDDLLGESESDSSKDKSSDHIKKESDSEAENVKAKRRKANAIASSDSEAGSSRRKELAAAKVSDFEDSEEESSEPVKKNKRKKKASDSDTSGGSSNEGGKKKRRRIKQIDSEVSGSDTENEGKSKHGRKNIRKVMGKNQLEEATKKAARREKERVARIAERQKMYNNLEFDESGKPDEVVLDKVVLDFDPETKEPLIEVDRGLVKKLKPHQANGIKFMWDACFESVKRIKKDKGSGCILAHCMGLGKTLQVVSLTHTLLTHAELTRVRRVLVVCPLSTVLNWVNEFNMWLKHAEKDYDVDIYELSRHKQNTERAFQLSQWFLHGGVCVLGYEMFRNLSADNVKKYKKKMLRQLQEALVDPGPDLVVCDEGHLLKNEKTSLSQSMNRVKTLRRIVLTGTPLQNNLKEYYCMVQFVKPNLLGKYNEYLNRFVNPITNGQYTDSTEQDIRVMKRRSHVLHKMLDGAVQRRDYGVLAPFLPPKHEYVLFITLNEVQIKLYQHYLDNYSRRPLPGKSSGFLFPDFQSLQRIWTHPLVLKYNSERYEIMQQKKREREEEDSEGSLVDFIDDDSTPEETSSEDESDSLSDMSDDSRKKSKKKKSAKKNKKDKDKDREGKAGPRRGTRANPVEAGDEELDPDIVEAKCENPTEWWIPLLADDQLDDMRNSHKLVLLFEILRQCEAIGDKLLVFSQSLYSLDLIEHFLGKVDEATQEGRIDEKLGGHVGSWAPGVDYFRLDGSTSCENRSIWCKNFNREDNPRARLFLISTRAGGLGINLVAANRVVIFDVSWNPSHDVQSIFRVYRFGQKKPCYVYRFLAMGTMEEKIYERQVTKQAISKRVIDEQQIDRHYAENDLAELYKFEPRPPAPRPVPLVPKDRLFAEMLKEHEALIYKFHEHDSLLENKEEETLSEEERKAAWEDFENEKNRPPPAAFPAWPMHNGMVPGLIAQQQQQLAYAAVAAMLRKDMPNLSDDNIRSMLPLIYAANPAMFGGYDYGLMQKVQELSYKYSAPGMMPGGMNMNMNPMMNAGSGAAAGAGAGGMSASGLQYEPPWQRQQQQQHQMRLQQLLQHQNQMGAKLYAGGLGSRDPVAMALQQQRAREIMLGGAGRPRGRPPAQPRAQPHDVVNLDSD